MSVYPHDVKLLLEVAGKLTQHIDLLLCTSRLTNIYQSDHTRLTEAKFGQLLGSSDVLNAILDGFIVEAYEFIDSYFS